MPVESVHAHFRALADSGAWASLYEGAETAANTSFRVRLARTLELLPSEARRVLDVGCGPAPLAPPLVRRGATYVGTDFVASMLREARERNVDVQLARADARLPFLDDAFDAVAALGFVEYLADPLPSLREMRRVVKPGGTVVVSIPKRYHIDAVTVALAAPVRKVAALVWGRRSDSIRRTLLTTRELDALAREAGLRPDGGEHYHFTPLPYPLTVFAPAIALRAGRALEYSESRRRHPFLAHGYLGRYRRD